MIEERWVKMDVKEVKSNCFSIVDICPYAVVNIFQIEKNYFFIRIYDLENKKWPFYFLIFEKHGFEVKDKIIYQILTSNLVCNS